MSVDSVAQDQLRAFVERIERMEEEKQAVATDIKEIYAEAKANGFDVKVLRQIVRIRKQDYNERMEQEALLELYMAALGMQLAPRGDFGSPGLPLEGGDVRAPDAAAAALAQRPGATRAMKKAASAFRESVEKLGGATITVGGHSVTIPGK